VTDKYTPAMPTPEPEKKIILTATERRVLQLVAEGLTNPQIASELCLSVPTIKWYRRKLRTRFGVATTMQMVRRAIELKMI
ncbi:MAG: helix-turn-helix transcriptional regulator, partial [Bacteroidales bacterium]|nr:helix-turn-helix transcriptional regulator [Bacteroidales bacterium]